MILVRPNTNDSFPLYSYFVVPTEVYQIFFHVNLYLVGFLLKEILCSV